MKKRIRQLLHRFLPVHFRDPFGLAARLLASRDPAAYFALASVAGQVICWPLDMALRPFERQLYEKSPEARLPIIFVLGPPRSGTTLVAQTLISHLPVAYINNLSYFFPHAPLMANKMVTRALNREAIGTRSYYGKTTHLQGHNDGLHIWDRWLGKDRTKIPEALTPAAQKSIKQFFGAYEAASGLPLVAKNNNLNAFAHLIAAQLPNTYFICLNRDPLFLGQSLLLSRRHVHGSDEVSYGIDDPAVCNQDHSDPVTDVCRQIRWYQAMEKKQQDLIGPERFWVVSYEDFCASPGRLVGRVAKEILKLPTEDQAIAAIPAFKVSKRVRLSAKEFDRLQIAATDLSSAEELQQI